MIKHFLLFLIYLNCSAQTSRLFLDKILPPEHLEILTADGRLVYINYKEFAQIQDGIYRTKQLNEYKTPDTLTVDGKPIPYYSTWNIETDSGRKQSLSLWEMDQANKYKVSPDALRKAKSNNFTQQCQRRDEIHDSLFKEFKEKYAISITEVNQAISKYYNEQEKIEMTELANSIGMTNYRINCWGPASENCGIVGYIDNEQVTWFKGKIYKKDDVLPDRYTK